MSLSLKRFSLIGPTLCASLISAVLLCAPVNAASIPTQQTYASMIEELPAKERFLFIKELYENKKLAEIAHPEKFLPDEDEPLREYVQAWHLIDRARAQNFDEALENEILRFITEHDGLYIAERLRTDWLLLKANEWNEKRQWGYFRQLRQELVWNKNEPAVVCWDIYHQLQLARKGTLRADKAESFFNVLKNAQYRDIGVCRRAANELIEKAPTLAFPRIAVLIQHNRISQARTIVNDLIAQKRLPTSARQALNQPSRWYRQHRNRLAKQNKFVLQIAAYRLAGSNFDAAVRIADTLKGRLNKQERSALWARLGYLAALNHDTKALDYYAKGGSTVCSSRLTANSNDCLEWRARSALRLERWDSLLSFIHAMPATLAKKEAWTYWQGVAYAQKGQTDNAKKCWEKLNNVRTFYGKLAAEALGNPIVYPLNIENPIDDDLIDDFGKQPAVVRARTFYEHGLITEGNREWQWAIRNRSDQQLLAAALWAEENLYLQRSINTAIRLALRMPVEHRLLYPRPFDDEIEKYSKKVQIDPNWVYGLIRQESRFIAIAQSSVGANGLMQIMPATAKWIAKELAIEDFKPSSIYEINTNVRFGTFYLRTLLDRLDNNIVLSTAGYNAGPNRAHRWRSTLTKPVEGAIFIETIPFNETRLYVQNVLANTVEYAQAQSKKVNSFKALLGTVTPETNAVVNDKI